MALPPGAKHSPDFCLVIWNGVELSFSPLQATIAAELWRALDEDVPEMRAATLLERAGSELREARLDPLFFRHPAWKTLIIRGRRRGTYRLNPDAFLEKEP
jgi:hypothetical protein